MKIILFTLACLLSLPLASFAGNHSNAVLQDYLQLQTLLAHDTFTGVKEAAAKLSEDAKQHHDKALSAAAEALTKATDLATARAQFEKVSTLAVAGFRKHLDATVESVYCPMKKLRWIQKKGPIENPFYGKEMLECGVKDQ